MCKAVLRRATPVETGGTISAGDLEIDPEGFTVRKGGEEIALTATEFRLLLELARRPKQVFTRELLLELRLELRLPRRLTARRRRHPAPAGEGRGRPEAARADQDRARRRLPLRLGLVTLRRRLTVALALAVGLSAAALGTGSYFLVRHNLLADSVDAGVLQTRRNLELSSDYKSSSKLLQAFERRGLVSVVAKDGSVVASFSFGLRQVPAQLRDLVRRGQLGYQRTLVAGDHYLVTGGPGRRA